MSAKFPLVYPILDSSFIPTIDRPAFLDRLGWSLADAGVRLLEYRNKAGTDAEVLRDARVLRRAMPSSSGIQLVMDDRVDVAMVAGFDGVHVDHGDLPALDARQLLGIEAIIGTSASSDAELMLALTMPVDYIAFGPVFATTTKHTTVKPIGIEGVQRFRRAAGEGPTLVAAAGITLETAAEVLAAGASSVAVGAAIFRSADPVHEFERWTVELTQPHGQR